MIGTAVNIGCMPVRAWSAHLGQSFSAVQAQLLGTCGQEVLPARAVLVLQPPYRTYRQEWVHERHSMPCKAPGNLNKRPLHSLVPLRPVHGHFRARAVTCQ